MIKKRGRYKILALISIVLIAFVIGYVMPSNNAGSSSQSTSLSYKGYVCVYKNGELIDCDHNVLYDNGRNITRDLLGVGSNAPILNISICNASAACGSPVAAGSEAFTAYTNCGLANVQGTYNTLQANPGNWTVTKTFTSTCDAVNMTSTRLTNTTGSIFAGNTFTLVTLQTNDQLTINWTLMVS